MRQRLHLSLPPSSSSSSSSPSPSSSASSASCPPARGVFTCGDAALLSALPRRCCTLVALLTFLKYRLPPPPSSSVCAPSLALRRKIGSGWISLPLAVSLSLSLSLSSPLLSSPLSAFLPPAKMEKRCVLQQSFCPSHLSPSLALPPFLSVPLSLPCVTGRKEKSLIVLLTEVLLFRTQTSRLCAAPCLFCFSFFSLPPPCRGESCLFASVGPWLALLKGGRSFHDGGHCVVCFSVSLFVSGSGHKMKLAC